MKRWRCSYNVRCPDREFKQTLNISAEDEHRADLKARLVMRKLFRAAGIVIRRTSIRRDLKAEECSW